MASAGRFSCLFQLPKPLHVTASKCGNMGEAALKRLTRQPEEEAKAKK